MSQTIFALATGRGPAGIAVVRISGPDTAAALVRLTNRALPAVRRAERRDFLNDEGVVIDRGLALWFPGPASFSGEDMAELHVHGGRAVIAALIDTLAKQTGLRPAEAGEFTRRAFEHEKLDLTAAEGLADLVAAETEAQRRQALRQLDGALGARYENWRSRLASVLAHLEAEIDFPDEDLPAMTAEMERPVVAGLLNEIRQHLADGHRGERLREGVSVVILGPPNVGKSSLLNMLSKREAAIVSEIAGTTRDVIEVHLDLGGFPIILADTAGLRQAADVIETEGVRRALDRAGRADLRIILLDATAWPEIPEEVRGLIDRDALVAVNKIDQRRLSGRPQIGGVGVLPLSIQTGEGAEALLAALESSVAELTGHSEQPAITRVRHRQALEECAARLEEFMAGPAAPELGCEDIRLAMRSLGRITGRVDVEDILDVIFRDFCIGK